MYDSPVFALVVILSLLCLISVAIVWLATGRIPFLSIYFSARRLKLHDKGFVGIEVLKPGVGETFLHAFCKTRIRIGITAKGDCVQYCWRCEKIFDDSDSDNDPKGKEPVPEETVNKVVKLFGT